MIRYTLFILVTFATAAAAIAAIAPAGEDLAPLAPNVTIIEKNQAFPFYGPVVVEDCAVEDCSEVRG